MKDHIVVLPVVFELNRSKCLRYVCLGLCINNNSSTLFISLCLKVSVFTANIQNQP